MCLLVAKCSDLHASLTLGARVAAITPTQRLKNAVMIVNLHMA